MNHQAMLRFIIVDALYVDGHVTEIERSYLHHVIVVDDLLNEPLPTGVKSFICEAVKSLMFFQESFVLFVMSLLLCHKD